jgi:hypothetical protein
VEVNGELKTAANLDREKSPDTQCTGGEVDTIDSVDSVANSRMFLLSRNRTLYRRQGGLQRQCASCGEHWDVPLCQTLNSTGGEWAPERMWTPW